MIKRKANYGLESSCLGIKKIKFKFKIRIALNKPETSCALSKRPRSPAANIRFYQPSVKVPTPLLKGRESLRIYTITRLFNKYCA